MRGGTRASHSSTLVSMTARVLESAAVRLLALVFAATVFATGAVASTPIGACAANLIGGSANAPGTQAWTLDPLGNWADVSTWTSGIITGQPTGGHFHRIKAKETVNGLVDWLRRIPNATAHDRLVAQSLLDDLLDALGTTP